MNAVGEQESKCFGKGKDGSIDSRLSAGKQLDRLEKKRSGYCVDRGSCYSDCINICRNRSETLLELTASRYFSVAGIFMEAGTDRKRGWNCADGNRLDPGNPAGMYDFSDSDSSGGRCRDLHAGTRKGKKKGDSVCAVFTGWLSDTVSLRDRKKQGVNRYEQKKR